MCIDIRYQKYLFRLNICDKSRDMNCIVGKYQIYHDPNNLMYPIPSEIPYLLY